MSSTRRKFKQNETIPPTEHSDNRHRNENGRYHSQSAHQLPASGRHVSGTGAYDEMDIIHTSRRRHRRLPFSACCGSSMEDIYHQERQKHHTPDDIHDTTRDKVDRRHHKSGQSPSHPSSLNVPESGGSAPPTLYSQLPVGYVSRSVDSDSAHEGSTSSIRKNAKDIAPDVNVVDNPVTTRLPPPPQSISGHSVRSYAESAVPGSSTSTAKNSVHRSTNSSSADISKAALLGGRDGVSGHGSSPVTPVTASTPTGLTFAEMNRMCDVTGVRFDRTIPAPGEAIAALGDAHLFKLEEACKVLLKQILAEKAERRKRHRKVSSDTSTNSGSSAQNSPVAGVPSGDYTEVALIYTEVLQLQNRPKEAVIVLFEAIEELNADLALAKQHRANSTSGSGGSGTTSRSNSGAEFEHLKKMKAYCHRRIGSLYKLTSRYNEAEEHVRKYISILERQSSGVSVKRERVNAYALLASIYEMMGRSDDAATADRQALELSCG